MNPEPSVPSASRRALWLNGLAMVAVSATFSEGLGFLYGTAVAVLLLVLAVLLGPRHAIAGEPSPVRNLSRAWAGVSVLAAISALIAWLGIQGGPETADGNYPVMVWVALVLSFVSLILLSLFGRQVGPRK